MTSENNTFRHVKNLALGTFDEWTLAIIAHAEVDHRVQAFVLARPMVCHKLRVEPAVVAHRHFVRCNRTMTSVETWRQ